MDTDHKMRIIANEMRSYGAIAILGAGISLAQGFPLTSHLQMLLWRAFDLDENALDELAKKLGQSPNSAKILIGDDPYKTNLALDILASSPYARKIFQDSFKKLNDDKIKNPSISHDIISKLLHRGNIEMVISLNWDTLLETAYSRHYASIIHPDRLKKPHGDATNPNSNWILPNEVSNLSNELVQEISTLVEEYPRILLIIGYSGNDEEIATKIIAPLSNQLRIVRISPNASGEYDIPLTAEEALPKLYKYIHDGKSEIPGCEYINFNNKHDLGTALSGISLSPSDVNVCPRLPEVNIAKKQLEVAGSSVIMGKMGCGKSLIAYQTAYDLNKHGWEILRLNEMKLPKELLVDQLLNLPNKSLLIIDNAQGYEKDDLSYFLEKASSDKLMILIITTEENITRHNKIHVAGENSVSIIARDFKNRQNEILPIIRKFDESIGEGYFDMPLEQRINAAAESSKIPWQFNFILTGGWDRAEDELTILRENERFDLLLAAISIKQIVSLDTGSSLEWLEKASHILGKDKSWMNNAIQALKDRHLIIEGKTICCPHVRFSEVVIDIVFKNRQDNCYDQLVNLFRLAINEEISSLKGVFWAFNMHLSTRSSLYLFKSIIDPPTLNAIINRCWAASSNEDIYYASRILNSLLHWFPNIINDIKSNSEIIAKWLMEADDKSVYGLGTLLNYLSQIDPELTKVIISNVDPQMISRNLAKISISDAYVWGYILGRLVNAASEDWLMQLKISIDSSSIEQLFLNVDINAQDISSLDVLAEGISSLNHSLGIKLIELAVPKIAEAINKNIIKFNDITHILWFVLGFAPDFLRHDEPSKDQRIVALKLADAINVEAFAQFISNSSRREWKTYADFIKFLNEVMPEKANQIADLIDLDIVDNNSKNLWIDLPHELMYLIAILATGNEEHARSWINQHSSELENLYPQIVAIAPEAAINLLNQGYKLDLTLVDSVNWGLATLTIKRLSSVDKKLASNVLITNQQGISQGFILKRKDSDYDCFSEFIELMSDLTPDILKECLESLDPITIRTTWAERLQGNDDEKQAVETLIKLIIDENITSLVDVAQELRNINR
jgi:hypothetical protein